MKVVTRSIAVSALVMSFAGAAQAQSGGAVGGMNGPQSGGAANASATAGGANLGTGPSSMPGVGTVGSATAIGATGGVGAGPVLPTMRANGTSLNMSPDPRAPNLAGRTLPPR